MVQRGRPDGNEFFPGNAKRAPAVPRRDRERGAAGLPSRARTEVEGAPASARTQPSRGDRPLHAGGGAVRLSLGRGRGARTRRSTLDPASPPRAVGRPQTWRTPAGGKRVGPAEEPSRRGRAGRRGSCAVPPRSPSPRWRQPRRSSPPPDRGTMTAMAHRPDSPSRVKAVPSLLCLSTFRFFLPPALCLWRFMAPSRSFVSAFWQPAGPSADLTSTCSSLRFALAPQ